VPPSVVAQLIGATVSFRPRFEPNEPGCDRGPGRFLQHGEIGGLRGGRLEGAGVSWPAIDRWRRGAPVYTSTRASAASGRYGCRRRPVATDEPYHPVPPHDDHTEGLSIRTGGDPDRRVRPRPQRSAPGSWSRLSLGGIGPLGLCRVPISVSPPGPPGLPDRGGRRSRSGRYPPGAVGRPRPLWPQRLSGPTSGSGGNGAGPMAVGSSQCTSKGVRRWLTKDDIRVGQEAEIRTSPTTTTLNTQASRPGQGQCQDGRDEVRDNVRTSPTSPTDMFPPADRVSPVRSIRFGTP